MNYMERIPALQDAIRDRGWTGIILFYSRDVFYYAGTAQPSFLVVLPNDFSLFLRNGLEYKSGQSSFPSEKIGSARSLTESAPSCSG